MQEETINQPPQTRYNHPLKQKSTTMPFIPAICNDPSCRAIYPSDFTIKTTDEANTHSDTTLPCPTCNGIGNVSNLDYSTLTHLITDKIFSTADIQLLKQIQKKIDKTLKKNKPHKTVKELEKSAVSWQEIWSHIPDNKAEAYAFLRLVFSFISSAIITHAEAGKIADKAVLINKSFNHYYQLVSPKLATTKKRPQLKSLTDAIRKTRK